MLYSKLPKAHRKPDQDWFVGESDSTFGIGGKYE